MLKQPKPKDARENLVLSETGDIPYIGLMRKFTEANKEQCRYCKPMQAESSLVHHRSAKDFPTGSSYEGGWDVLGMSGYGIYTFPRGYYVQPEEHKLSGVAYEGEFKDGEFHGAGELHYDVGVILRGTWKHGELLDRNLIFEDGLEYSEKDWMYCQMPDRRYTIEYDHGLKAAGESYITAEQPSQVVPTGFYDTGDGLFDPETKAVYKYDNLNIIIRAPSEQEQKWILENCRTSPDYPLGPQPFLYEEWVEPQVEPKSVPLPACPTLATAYLFESESEEEEGGDALPEIFWRPTRASRVSEAWKFKRTSQKFSMTGMTRSESKQLPIIKFRKSNT